MKRFSTKTMKFAMALTVSIAPILLAVSPASASCTITIRNTTTTDDRDTDTSSQIRYESTWDCSENSGEVWAKVSTSNAMIDTAGDVAPSGSGTGIGRYGGGLGGLTGQLQASTTYFVQAYVRTSSGTYSSGIIAIATTAAAPTATTTTSPSSSGSSSGSTTTATPSKVVARTTTTTTQLDAVEDDGDSEEDFADLGISNKSGKFDMRISSSFAETEMMLRAYKKGSKSVTWNFTTNSNGQYRIITSRLLKGFTMSLWIDGEKWDSLVVR